MCASVVTDVDAPPVLESAEHVFDLVALAIERIVVLDWDLAVELGGYAGGNAPGGDGLAEPVGVVTSVAEQGFGLGQGGDHQRRALVVAHLAL